MTTALKTERRNPALEYIEQHRRRLELERELDETKAKLTSLEEEVLEQFTDLGVRSLNTKDGEHTVYLQKRTFASLIPDKARAHSVMTSHGLGYMIKPSVNASTLASWVLEQEKENIPIPEEVQGVLNVTHKHFVRVKSS